ncbi:MAG: DUF6588 family protein [Alkalispirochaeta sp.]
MKRTLIIAAVLAVMVAGVPVFGQDTFTLNTFKSSFETFSDEFATSLPMNSTIGLNWSDAYIGQLLAVPPNFGVGVTTGVTTIPGSVFTDLLDDLGVSASGGVDDVAAIGLPLPGYAIDGRVGGFILPFDVGVKVGILPAIKLGDVEAEYTNVGFDVRYAVLEGGILPKVSVGVGYNYLSGRIATPLGLGATEIGGVEYNNNTYTLVMSDPDLEFGWEANVFDFKAQVSKSFLIVEPHFGVGASVGTATTTTGLSTDITVQGGSVTADQIGSAAGVDIANDGVTLESSVSPVAFRLFGGASLNLVFFRLDLGAMYNLNSGALGGTVGARFQL